jgi:predicted nucleic acid-binding protein
MSGRTFIDGNVLVYSVDESPAEKVKHERAVELLSAQPDSRPIPVVPLACGRHGWSGGPRAFP